MSNPIRDQMKLIAFSAAAHAIAQNAIANKSPADEVARNLNTAMDVLEPPKVPSHDQLN